MQKFIKPNVHGVLWPNFWLYNSGDNPELSARGKPAVNVALPERILKVKFLISQDILYHVANLCTFGLCSPFLATIIIVCLVMKLLTWVMVFGRFLYVRSSANVRSRNCAGGDGVEMKSFSEDRKNNHFDKFVVDDAVAALSEACIGLLGVFDMTIWPIVWFSCLFFAVLTFDIAADEVVRINVIFVTNGCIWCPPWHLKSEIK